MTERLQDGAAFNQNSIDKYSKAFSKSIYDEPQPVSSKVEEDGSVRRGGKFKINQSMQVLGAERHKVS